MPLIKKKSMQTTSWNKAMAHRTSPEASLKQIKSAPSLTVHPSKQFQQQVANNGRATALMNKSNVFRQPTKPLNTSIKKTLENKIPTCEAENNFPSTKENMFICSEAEDNFEDLVPKQYRLNEKDIKQLTCRNVFYIHSPISSDTEDDWQFDLELPSLVVSQASYKIDMSLSDDDGECCELFTNVPLIDFGNEI